MTSRQWLGKLWGRASRRPSLTKQPRPRSRLAVEKLEDRFLLSFSPTDVRHAYGFDRVAFLDSAHAQVAADGHGETIAIVDWYDDPNISSDLTTFDSHFGLPAPPSFRKVNQTGGTTYPPPDQNAAGEISLDVEYAHAMAPGASILLVEANDNGSNNLDTAVQYAAGQPGVVAVSMSYGSGEYSGETGRDSVFTHAGVTYLSSTGDHGAPGQYQAFSPNVVAVGGTTLTLDGSGNYSSESGWSGSGGGISFYEAQPSYQNGVVTQSTTQRTIPDISFVADPGVTFYDTYGGGMFYNGQGTSASAPIMAGLVAVVDQGRSYLNGLSSYNGRDFLNALYHLPDNAVNDITTGNNGYQAGPGYDLVTGRGTPIVQRFVAGLTGDPVLDPTTGNLLVVGGGRLSSDTLTLNTSGSQLTVSFNLSAPVPGNGRGSSYSLSYPISSVHSIEIDTHGEGSNPVSAVDINATPAGVPTTVRTFGNDSVTLGNGSVQGILGPVTLDPMADAATLTVDDSTDGATHGAIMLSNAGTGFGQITGLAPSTISYRSAATSAVTVKTGTGSNTVDVRAAASALTIDGDTLNPTVNIGSQAPNLNGTLAAITAPVTVTNTSGATLNVDDSGDPTGQTGTVSGTQITGMGLGAGGVINYNGGALQLSSLTVHASTRGTNGITVTGTPAANTTLSVGAATVNVQATSGALTIDGGGATDQVNVGSQAPNLGGTLTGITGSITLTNTSLTTLSLDDSGDPNFETGTITGTAVTGLGMPSGVAVNYTGLYSLTVSTGSGGATVTATSTSITTSVIGAGSASNTLVGPDAATTWNVTGSNTGSIPALSVYFFGFQNLTGGAGNNTFVFSDGAALSGTLTGGGGTNTLDYSAYTTSVVVDLEPAVDSATGVGGAISGITTVIGGSGAPGTPGLYNLLIGSDVGGDTLQGGTGRRNLLVAGGGASTLIGGDGEDLLIGGTTIYDTDPALANWLAIAAYWAGTDDFATRSANLQSGNGVPLLDATTVTGNGGGNTMQGNGGVALIYTDGQDSIDNGFAATSLVTIAP
jgi:hypothetical protein